MEQTIKQANPFTALEILEHALFAMDAPGMDYIGIRYEQRDAERSDVEAQNKAMGNR